MSNSTVFLSNFKSNYIVVRLIFSYIWGYFRGENVWYRDAVKKRQKKVKNYAT